jgi:hypothetical protein
MRRRLCVRVLGVRVATVQPFPQVVNGVVGLVRMTGEHLDHFLARCTPYVIPPACPGRSPMQEANVPPGPDERLGSGWRPARAGKLGQPPDGRNRSFMDCGLGRRRTAFGVFQPATELVVHAVDVSAETMTGWTLPHSAGNLAGSRLPANELR